ncbi:late competence development ComFB family protein [Selenihalanaerobacter shriftii]|uniref:Competence protein ComFB n=1 Tax=Selenihalanaerobacter shriftii TaxID=142842 RepID=A0A1T4LBI4_9FIRM|nr:late competence development ComFB family protein [Selenihalanaerobacter shriftii]SJZ51867.1 competence protein ComFB [Selenihalanaerobacter shriftii]
MVSGNLIEDEVMSKVDEILTDKEEFCDCDQCKQDILALALSNLKPRYAGSEEGKIILNSTDLSSEQTQLDILRSVLEAAKKVHERPHHDRG